MAANRSWVDEYREKDPMKKAWYTYSDYDYSDDDNNNNNDGRRGGLSSSSYYSFYSDSLYYTNGKDKVVLTPFDEALDKAAAEARAALASPGGRGKKKRGKRSGKSREAGGGKGWKGGKGGERMMEARVDVDLGSNVSVGVLPSGVGPLEAIYVVRHGESTYNEWASSWKTYATCGGCCTCDPGIVDAPLSGEGEKQVRKLSTTVWGGGGAEEGVGWGTTEALATVGLVVVSPLRRALATAQAVYGGTGIPVVVSPWVTEAMDTACDVGSGVVDLAAEYPSFEWQLVDDHAAAMGTSVDAWWPQQGVKESMDAVAVRAGLARNWIASIGVSRVAVVAHSTFLKVFTGQKDKLPNAGVGVVSVSGFSPIVS